MEQLPERNVFKRLGPPPQRSKPPRKDRPLISAEGIENIRAHIRPIPQSSSSISSSSTQVVDSTSSSSSSATRPQTSSVTSASSLKRSKNTCPSCQQDDHQRSSSSKCPKRKLSRKLLVAEKNVSYESFTIKTSFKKWLTETKLRNRIHEDVVEMSAMYIEATIALNFAVCKSVVEGIPITSEPDMLRIFQQLKQSNYNSKNAKPLDEEYKRLRTKHNRPLYESRHRTTIIQELAKQLQTAAKNCICVHMRSRIRRWMKHRFYFGFLQELTKYGRETLLTNILDDIFAGTNESDHTEEVRRAMKNDLGDADLTNLETEWWTFYKMAYQLQQYFIRNQPPPRPPPTIAVQPIKKKKRSVSMRSFSLCPLASHGLKHIRYTTDAFYELLRATDLIGTDAKSNLSDQEFLVETWSSYFNVNEFHKPSRNKTFGMTFTTNSVDASIQMLRQRRQVSTRSNDWEIIRMDFNPDEVGRYVGVDPGRIQMYNASTHEVSRTQQVEETTKSLKGSTFRDRTGAYGRQKRLHKYTYKLLNSLNDLHQNEELTSKDARNYVAYAEYRLEWFDRRQNTFGRRKIAREDWERKRRTQQELAKCANSLLGVISKQPVPPPQTIVFWGDGDRGARPGIRGVRPPCSKLFHHIKHHPKCRALLLTFEGWSTKLCATCFTLTRPYELRGQQLLPNTPKFPQSRIRVCPNCNVYGGGKIWNRDANGSRNILINVGLPLLLFNENNLMAAIPRPRTANGT